MKNKVFLVIVLLIIFSIFGYNFFVSDSSGPAKDTIKVEKRDIVQEVSVTGKVVPKKSVSLSFDRIGKIIGMNVSVGDTVKEGDVLAYLDAGELSAELAQTEANLRAEEAKLLDLKKGAKPEEIAISEARVIGAISSISDAKTSLADEIRSVYAKADDAIRNKIDKYFDNPKSSNPMLSFVVSDGSLKSEIEFDRYLVEIALNKWADSLLAMGDEVGNGIFLEESKNNLSTLKNFLNKTSIAVNALIPTSNLSQITIDTYKTDTSTARTNINSAILSLSTAEQRLNSAENNLIIYQEELNLKKAGATIEQILAQEARVDQVKAMVKSIKVQISKTYLRSPIAGKVAKKNFDVGEVVSANSPAFLVLSEGNLEVEANITEADISKIKIGDSTKMTLDAYGDQVVFLAKVSKIDPAETIIEGIATYKTTFEISEQDERLKPGMTANLDILIATKNSVLAIPQRNITSKNGLRFVRVYLSGGQEEERQIEVGLRGSDGFIEIISGLREGELVLASF